MKSANSFTPVSVLFFCLGCSCSAESSSAESSIDAMGDVWAPRGGGLCVVGFLLGSKDYPKGTESCPRNCWLR